MIKMCPHKALAQEFITREKKCEIKVLEDGLEMLAVEWGVNPLLRLAAILVLDSDERVREVGQARERAQVLGDPLANLVVFGAHDEPSIKDIACKMLHNADELHSELEGQT